MKDIILITGGSSGFGKATAARFAAEGATVIITGRSRERLTEAAAEIGAIPFVADAARAEDWRDLRGFIAEEYGRLDLLLNNAGAGVAIKTVAEQTAEEIEEAIATNLTSTILGCQTFAPMLLEQGHGTVINISSVCAKHAWPGWSVYAAAKWGVLGFTKGLTTELSPHGIRVTCLVPGAGATNFDASAHFDRGAVPGLKAEHIAEAIHSIYRLPAQVWVEETTVWGMDQVVIPL